MDNYLNQFLKEINDFDLSTLDNDKHNIYIVDEKFRIIYYNSAYKKFAEENDGEPLISMKYSYGANLFDAISGNLKEIYRNKLQEIIDSGKGDKLLYECSSNSVYRLFMQKIYPLRNKKGLLFLNSLAVEETIDEKSSNPVIENYLQNTGFINQCSNCRRTQRKDESEIWDWVGTWVIKQPKNVSHTICPICFDYYWKNAQ